MDVTDEVTCTLRAESHHPPCIIASDDLSLFENHSQDTRYTGPLEKAPTVNATYGMGGNNQPFVVDTPKMLKIRSGCEGGGKGALIQEDKSATLSCNNDQTLFVPKAYGICSDQSNSMLSANPHSGIYEAETSRTLDRGGGNPSCNQGGIAVVGSFAIQGSMIGREEKNDPQGGGINEDVSFTLNTVDRHAVYAMTTGYYAQVTKDKAPTLLSRDYKDAAVVSEPAPEPPGYYVRRLTPTECARLQGFADWWCSDLGTEEPTDEEIAFWENVWETHRRILGGAKSRRPNARSSSG